MGHDSHQSTANWFRFVSLCESVIERETAESVLAVRETDVVLSWRDSSLCNEDGLQFTAFYHHVVSLESLIVFAVSVTCEFTRLGTPSQGASRTVIPLLCMVNLNCNAVWTLEFPAWPVPLPPLLDAGGSCGLCEGPQGIHTLNTLTHTHTPASVLTKWEAYIFPDIGECFCREETESGLLCRIEWGGSICMLTKRNNSSAHTHREGFFLGWLHPSLEFAGKIEPRSDK